MTAQVERSNSHPGPSAQYLRTLVPKTTQGMAFGTRVLEYWVFGPLGLSPLSRRRGGDSHGATFRRRVVLPPDPARVLGRWGWVHVIKP